MDDNYLVKKKVKRFINYNQYTTLMFTLGLLLVLIGFSYAFFVYNKTGLYTHTITGGKMSIIYNENAGNNITIANAYPLTDVESITKGLEFEFTITGYNESDKNIYYAIEMDYGEDVENKTRFKDSDLKLSLYENDEIKFENEIFNNLDNNDIYYGYIDQGTSSESPVTNNYKLRIWINHNVIISDTLTDDYTTWSEADFVWFTENYPDVVNVMEADDFSSTLLSDYGVNIYTTTEFANRYANFKVNVKADLTYDDVDYLTYDANGGEFAPEKTSLTTGTVTTQKPVYRVEMIENISNNLSNLKANQIADNVTYEYKGFLGWSSTPDGEVEYISGDYYSGSGKILYAVYGDTVNKMVEYWPSELESAKSNITNVYFINELQGNIDTKYNAAEYKWDLSYDETSNVKGWIELDETESIETLYIASEGTTYLTNCYGLFADWSSLTNIIFDNVDTSMVTDMSYMFSTSDAEGYISRIMNSKEYNVQQTAMIIKTANMIEKLDLSSFNTSNVMFMKYMFGLGSRYESNLSNIEFTNIDTSSVVDMQGMFFKCSYLVSLDFLSKFNTNKVFNMSSMFSGCHGLESIDVSMFDTSNVENMAGMFSGCNNLTELDLNNFDTRNVIDMSYMFNGVSLDQVLDLKSLSTDNVTTMSYMFASCNIPTIEFNDKNMINVDDMTYMFSESRIENLYIERCEMNYNTDSTNFFGTVNYIQNISFKGCNNLINISFKYDKISTNNDCLKNVNFSNCNFGSRTSLNRLFYYCNNIDTIDFSNCNFGEITSMNYVFYSSSVKKIILKDAKSPNVTNMSSMFVSTFDLEEIDLTNFDTSNVVFMDDMFSGCSRLTTLDVSNFDTSKLEVSAGMFSKCSGLITLDLSDWDAPKLREMGNGTNNGMFAGCTNLSSLDISSFQLNSIAIRDAFIGMSKSCKIYVKDDISKISILDIESLYRPAWTTSNIIVKTS